MIGYSPIKFNRKDGSYVRNLPIGKQKIGYNTYRMNQYLQSGVVKFVGTSYERANDGLSSDQINMEEYDHEESTANGAYASITPGDSGGPFDRSRQRSSWRSQHTQNPKKRASRTPFYGIF